MSQTLKQLRDTHKRVIDTKQERMTELVKAITHNRDEISRLKGVNHDLAMDEIRLSKEIGDLRVEMDSIDKVLALAGDIDTGVTMPVEGQNTLLWRERVQSDTRRDTSYEVKAILVDGKRIILSCSCAAFIYTRGELNDGRKKPCKHIQEVCASGFSRFGFEGRSWLSRSLREAYALGFRGRVYFRNYGGADANFTLSRRA